MHEEISMNSAISNFKEDITKSFDKLKQLRVTVDAFFEAETLEMRETDAELADFCADLKRQLISETRERRLQQLQNIRDAIAAAMEEGAVPLAEDAVSVLSYQRALFEKVESIIKRVRQSLERPAEKITLCEAVHKVLMKRNSYDQTASCINRTISSFYLPIIYENIDRIWYQTSRK